MTSISLKFRTDFIQCRLQTGSRKDRHIRGQGRRGIAKAAHADQSCKETSDARFDVKASLGQLQMRPFWVALPLSLGKSNMQIIDA